VRVYVAGPLGSNPTHNAAADIRAAVVLREMGYTPICPHLMVLADMLVPHPDEWWLSWCLDLIDPRAIDAVCVYSQGRSDGTAAELERARSLGIPIFRDLATLERYRREMGR
jgi:hypothetical protein